MAKLEDSKPKPLIRIVVLAVLIVGALVFFVQKDKQGGGDDGVVLDEEKVREIAESEELILSLQRLLKKFGGSAGNLELPDWRTRRYFEPTVTRKGLAADEEDATQVPSVLDIDKREWAIAKEESEESLEDLRLLEPLFESVDVLDKFKIKVVKGYFLEDRSHYESKVSFAGAGEAFESGKRITFDGNLIVRWRKDEEGDWRISAWLMKDLTTRKSASQSFFTNMNKVAIPSPEERRNAELSIHDALIVAIGKTGRFTPPGGDFKYRFGFDSTAAHPSASIVDINQDGWDDFYFTARWGKNQLFVNQKDGTFKEEAAAYGLDILNHCTCAAFADFDNDGDPDVIVGRSYTHSMYLENRDGRFHDVSHEVFSRPLPAMVTAIAVADYNRDGLLDVYFSTYASGLTGELEKVFMTYEQQVILADKAAKEKDHEELLDALGPPNYLLVNRGDARFELAPENQQLEFWQPTLNAVWVDYDDDGDPDLYVSNDFGPDALMRNDHPKGFVNVTTTVGHPTMAGFGMGAGWGDYDLDGKQDLYVSNMYSKAGLRITEQVGKMDPRFVAFANGNRLYRQGEEGFEYTSGLEPPKHLVAKVGWSWGGQFVDFDNNGYLDIYVPTGYFTAPDAVAVEDDL